MQNLIYDQAVYDILYYDANLDVYRNDRFAGWQNMPANGTPLFTYGPLDYTLLTDATAAPSATPEAPAPSASGGPARQSAGCAQRLAHHGRVADVERSARARRCCSLLVVGAIVVVGGGLVPGDAPQVAEAGCRRTK